MITVVGNEVVVAAIVGGMRLIRSLLCDGNKCSGGLELRSSSSCDVSESYGG